MKLYKIQGSRYCSYCTRKLRLPYFAMCEGGYHSLEHIFGKQLRLKMDADERARKALVQEFCEQAADRRYPRWPKWIGYLLAATLALTLWWALIRLAVT